jgi:hypothetical protein
MAHEIQYTSDKTKSLEKAQGSDNRFNVSARSDSRSYYNSRDISLAFSLVWDDASSEAGDFIVYWANTDTTGKQLVIDSVGLNSENAASFKLHVVTGVAAAGASVSPFCLNRATPKTAQAIGMEAAGTAITGLTSAGVVDHASTAIAGHEEFRLDDRLRIGQDQAIAVEYEQGTTGRTWGVIFGYYE